VFFGESYPTRTKSFLESISADLVVAIGSSMTIPSLQRLVKKLTVNTYVINIQKTALPEEVVSCQIHHDIQDSFRHLA
jgi:NAD-dependent SIR2 family protein deacetylase